MRKKLIAFAIVMAVILVILLIIAVVISIPRTVEYGFAREVSEEEAALRLKTVQTAENWIGISEKDNSHQQIIDIYNGHSPLAQGYLVQYSDNWCAAFVSAVAIECGFTDIIPTECSCERQIERFRAIQCWQEQDSYVPLPGDLIYYSLKNPSKGDNTAWSDHVGIVVGTGKGYIKVIEGNNADQVAYRYIKNNDPRIRGFALPDYARSAA